MKHLIPIAVLTLSAALAAQSDRDAHSAASKTYFLLNGEHGHGGRTTSTTYALNASCGSGAVAIPATSPTYRLAAGYFGSIATSGSGKPWLAGVLPRFVTMRGTTNVTLHGTELNFGGTPRVAIGGQAASLVGTASGDRATVSLPTQPAPGWRPVRLTTTKGSTELPRGIGVLPMIYTDPAAASHRGFDVVFKGTSGDQAIWSLGVARLPSPISLGGIWHGLELSPVVILPGLSISGTDGELRLPIPPTPIPTTLYLQAVFSSSNPGYAPAAFSNLLVIHP